MSWRDVPLRVFSVTVQGEFCAAHALVIHGERETLHGHNFRVWVTISGPELDGDGLLCDFHEVERVLREVIGPWHNRNLHETPDFATLNPSAENIARRLAEVVSRRLVRALSRGACVSEVRVSEAPGCVASYSPKA